MKSRKCAEVVEALVKGVQTISYRVTQSLPGRRKAHRRPAELQSSILEIRGSCSAVLAVVAVAMTAGVGLGTGAGAGVAVAVLLYCTFSHRAVLYYNTVQYST